MRRCQNRESPPAARRGRASGLPPPRLPCCVSGRVDRGGGRRSAAGRGWVRAAREAPVCTPSDGLCSPVLPLLPVGLTQRPPGEAWRRETSLVSGPSGHGAPSLPVSSPLSTWCLPPTARSPADGPCRDFKLRAGKEGEKIRPTLSKSLIKLLAKGDSQTKANNGSLVRSFFWTLFMVWKGSIVSKCYQ